MNYKTLLPHIKQSLQFHQQYRTLRLKPRSIFPSFSKSDNNLPPYNHIVQLGDPVLRQPCQQIDPNDIQTAECVEIIDAMKYCLKRYDSLGVSAPQVGVPVQIMMMQFTKTQLEFWSEETRRSREMETIPLKIFINPTLHVLDKAQVSQTEGCTSMHGYSALGE